MGAFLRTALICSFSLATMLCQGALAGDIWNWDEKWEPKSESDTEDPQFFPELPDSVFELPHAVLSLQTHGNYFGSGDEFLLGGDVFTKEQIEAYIELKWEEIYAFEQAPHPIEFKMYYSS